MTEENGSEQPSNTTASSAAEEAGKKSRRGLVIGVSVVVALLLCAGVVAGIAIPARREAQRVEREKAQAAAFEKAEVAFGKAESALYGARRAMAIDAQWTRVEQAEENVATVKKQIATARTQIEEVKKQLALMPDSKGKSEYEDALAELTVAADGFEESSGELVEIYQVHVLVSKGDKLYTDADDAFEASIDAGNDGKYKTMLTHAEKSLKLFKQAKAIYQQAQDVRPGAGASGLVNETSQQVKIATMQVQMAKYGKAGKANAYNDMIDKIEAAEDKLVGRYEMSEWATEEVKLLTGKAVAALERGQKLHTTAAARLED